MDMLILQFEKHSCGQETLETAREQLHQELARSEGAQFHLGRYVGVDAVLEKLLQTDHPIQSSQIGCPHNHETSHCQHQTVNHCMLQSIQNSRYHTISSWIEAPQESQARRCQECGSPLQRVFSFTEPPKILAFSFPRLSLIHVARG